MNVYDLAVAGGGPAGCAAAITTARNGGRVLLLEAGAYPRHKVCGEFISAEALDGLRSLLDDEILLFSAPRIRQARLFLREQVISASLPAPAASLSRYELDAALWKAALDAGCDARQQVRVANISRVSNGGFLYRTSAGDFEASTAIVAAGRWSNLRKPEVNPPSQRSRWIGIKAHYWESSPNLSVDLYFFDGGYCGVQPIGNDAVNACAMVRSDFARDMEGVFNLHPELHARTRSWSRIADPVTTAPLVFSEAQPEQDGLLYAGDAAAFVDPFVGDGISLGLQTGMAAARAVASVWQGKASVEDAAQRYRTEYAARFSPVLRNAARMRRLLSLPASVQAIAGAFLRIPAVSRQVIRMTRVRTA